MSDFFNSWRRKAGLVALVLVCPLASLWLRSCRSVDVIPLTSNYAFISGSGKCYLSQELLARFAERHHPVLMRMQVADLPAEWRTWTVSEFEILPSFEGTRLRAYVLPYWSIVVPLTLLSAWLTFGKRRPKQQRYLSPIQLRSDLAPKPTIP